MGPYDAPSMIYLLYRISTLYNKLYKQVIYFKRDRSRLILVALLSMPCIVLPKVYWKPLSDWTNLLNKMIHNEYDVL